MLSALACSAAEPSGTLPVMYINTDGGADITSKDTYLTAGYWLDPRGAAGIDAIGTADKPHALEIRGRGNYSWWGFDKKPYRLKLDKKTALMGCKKSKHFALLAHADDNQGFLNNAVGLELSRMTGLPWTPEDHPVELVLNGDYKGLYFLTETIRVDADRVDIVEQPDLASDADAITGGWLLEIDNYAADPHITIAEDERHEIWFTYKTPEVLSPQQQQWITDELTLINSLIYSDDTDNCAWAEYIDLDQLARYYIVQEIVDDYESFHGSCYLYRQQGHDSKWQFGPVWDFGNAFRYEKNGFISSDRVWHQTWISGMVRFPAFMERVKAIWKEFYPAHADDIISYARNYASHIAAACEHDADRWPEYGNRNEVQKAEKIAQWLVRSMAWLDKKWNTANDDPGTEGTITVYFEDDNPTPWQQVKAFVWDKNVNLPLGNWPGTDCEAIDSFNGLPTWKISFKPVRELSDNAGLIFDNGGSGKGNQTDDFILRPGGVYRMSGYVSGITGASVQEQVTARAIAPGLLEINAAAPAAVSISGLTGIVRQMRVGAGTTIISLPAGFYIVNGIKIAI